MGYSLGNTRMVLLAAGLCRAVVAGGSNGTAFTFQGQLKDGALPANGSYDLSVWLFDSETGELLIAGPIVFDGGVGNLDPVDVQNGLFTVELDFGNVFGDAPLWLELEVRPHAEGGYTTLSPRQPITSAPRSASTRGIAVDDEGNVGIGTDSQYAALQVFGTIRSLGLAGGAVSAFNPNNQNAAAHFGWLNDVARIRIGGAGAGASGGFDIQRAGDRSLLRILNAGQVGIGTASPQAKLHVAGTPGVDGIMFPDGTVQTTAVGSAGGLWSSNGSSIFYPSGNVGIGTSTPQAKLELQASSSPRLRISHISGSPFATSGTGVLELKSNRVVGTPSKPHGALRFLDETDTTIGSIEYFGDDFAPGMRFSAGGAVQMGIAEEGVGVGTNTPQAKLDIVSDERVNLRLYRQMTDTLFEQMHLHGAAINSSGNGLFGNPLRLNDTSTNSISMVQGGGNVGIGTGSATLPLTKLHVDGGVDASLPNAASGYVMVGAPTGTNIIIDDNEVMARNNGAAARLALNAEGGDVLIGGSLDIGLFMVVTQESKEGECCVEAHCPPGSAVIGGGCSYDPVNGDQMFESAPMPGLVGWSCAVTGGPLWLHAFAICARIK